MRQFIKKLAIDFLGLGGAYPTALTGKDELVKLIRKLRPISPGIDLIRIGPEGDGGYLVPDDLDGIEACFSPGVAGISEFEKECAERGMKVFLADKSVAGPSVEHEKFSFIKKFVGATTSDDFMTIDDWVETSLPGTTSDLLLQIDIENYEYETFLSLSRTTMKRFRIITGEFHQLDVLWSRPFFELASSAYAKILQTHTCVHIHPNNFMGSLKKNGLEIPRVVEITFLRNDRVKSRSFATEFPHPLDSDNTTEMSRLVLPGWWYSD